MTMPKRKRSLEVTSKPPSHATRQRRYLERLLAGKVVVPVELDPAQTEKLREFGYVDGSELEDKIALGRAIRLLIDLMKK